MAAECGALLIEAGRPAEWLARVTELPAAVRQDGRIRLLEARAALAAGDLATVEQILAERPVVADLREGDNALSDAWFEYHLQRLSAAERDADGWALPMRPCMPACAANSPCRPIWTFGCDSSFEATWS